MASYETLDYLPDLTASEMAGAGALGFGPASGNSVGWDYSASAFGSEPYAILHALYRFTAIEGATYDIFSTSYFDPFVVLLYDAQGNAIVANSEADDPADYRLGDGGLYASDVVFGWRAPYSGVFYVDASWHQGSYYSFYSLALYEDRDTAVASNRAPVVATPLIDQVWLEGRALYFTVPAGTFTDPDGQTLALSAHQSNGGALPSWLSFDATTGRFTGTAPADSADLTIRVTATDPGGLSVYDDVVFRTTADQGTGQVLTGTPGADRLTGGPLADSIDGLDGDDSLSGGGGNDTLYGGKGNDTFDWDVEQRGGIDRFEGGSGNDTYVLNDAADQVVEAANNGTDKVWVPFDYSLAALPNVENLAGFGPHGLVLSGNDAANQIGGTDGDDTLQGGRGDDRLEGHGGSDTAVFSGNFADYTIRYSTSAGSYTVTDKVGGRDGSDVLTGIEFFQFADGMRAASATAFDTTAPTVLTFDPADESTAVAVGTDLRLVFSEPIQRGSGNIVLKTAAGAVVETFNAATSSALAVAGATLTINPSANLAPGTAYRVEFAAGSLQDLAGNAYAGGSGYNFSTRTADDHAGDATTTSRIGTGQSVIGNIETAGDADWFAVTLNAGQHYEFKLDGTTLADPKLDLYSASGALVGSDDDGGAGLNALLGFNATAGGTYFVAASGYRSQTGAYRLSVNSTTLDDFAANTSTTGRVAVGGSSAGQVETANDVDWFAVSLGAGQSYRVKLTGNGLADPILSIVNAAGAVLASDDDSGAGLDAQIDFTAPGDATYYLAAAGVRGGTGAYSVSVQTLAIDDYAAGTGTAGRVIVGGAAAGGTIETGGDQDWFAVSLTAGQTYQFRLQGVTLPDAALTLYGSSGTVITRDDNGGGGLDALITFQASTSGTHYLGAAAAGTQLGSYSLSAVSVTTDDYAADSSTTGRVSAGGAVTGSIESAADADWFAITLTAGERYTFQLDGTGLADPLLTLYSASGATLARDDDSGTGNNALLSFTATSSGTHFLAASAYGSFTGGYRLSASSAGTGSSDDYAGSTATTGRISIGGTASGRVETANDSDWFAVSLSAGQRYDFRLDGSGQNDPLLTLYSAQGAALASDDDGGGGYNALLSYLAPTSGTYYLGAQMTSGGTGAYSLSAQANTGTGGGTGGDGGFTIRVAYSGEARFQTYFDQAAQRWAQIIVGDLPDVSDRQFGTIDDLLIEASIQSIDGAGGILGQAGATAWRGASGANLAYRGIMQFDGADLAAMEAQGTLFSVVLHEMGHILGINGATFRQKGLVSGANYIGSNGVEAYRQLTGNLGLTSVPVETGGGSGTAGSHWSEAVFGAELMTGYAENAPPMPLSIITVGCLDDLGYTVNYGAADAYVVGA